MSPKYSTTRKCASVIDAKSTQTVESSWWPSISMAESTSTAARWFRPASAGTPSTWSHTSSQRLITPTNACRSLTRARIILRRGGGELARQSRANMPCDTLSVLISGGGRQEQAALQNRQVDLQMVFVTRQLWTYAPGTCGCRGVTFDLMESSNGRVCLSVVCGVCP